MQTLLKEKTELSRKQEKINLVNKEMFNILEQANLNSIEEISELELFEKDYHNLEIRNSIKASLKNLENFIKMNLQSLLIDQSIKNFNKTSEFDLKIQDFRENFINIQRDIENLIFGLILI